LGPDGLSRTPIGNRRQLGVGQLPGKGSRHPQGIACARKMANHGLHRFSSYRELPLLKAGAVIRILRVDDRQNARQIFPVLSAKNKNG
jgi:hypothetical protein